MRWLVLISLWLPAPAVLAEQNAPVSELVKFGIEPNTESIGSYLRSLVEEGNGRQEFSEWIQLLGDTSFQRRESATRSLVQARVVHFDLLEQAASSDDPEVQFRAKMVLEQLHKHPPEKRRDDVLHVVLSVIAEQRVKNLTGPLIAVIPMISEPSVQRLSVEALNATVNKDDTTDLRAAIKERSPTMRIAALSALEQLLGSDVDGEAVKLLNDSNEAVRLAAARTLANLGDRRSLRVLAQLMASDTSIIRSRAVYILRQLTGQRFGFAPHGNENERTAAAEKWFGWINDDGKAVKLKFPIKDFSIDSRGLALHFSFSKPGNPAVDESGCGNHGTMHNARRIKGGHIGAGCHLDGRGDFIRIANSDKLEIQDRLTLAVWVKLDSFGPGGYGNEEGHIIKKGDPLWWNPSYGLGYRKGTGRAKFVIGHPKNPVSRGGADLYSESLLETDRWHHLVGTYDGKTAKLYIDGRLDVDKKYEGTIRGDRAPVMIGGGKLFSKSDFANHFAINGTVDDIRIYNRALTADEVALLFED